MTATEWATCRDPYRLLTWVRRQGHTRKHRLFNIACCRAVAPLFASDADWACVSAMEQFADDGKLDPTAAVTRAAHEAAKALTGAFRYGRSMAFGPRLRGFLAAEGRLKALRAVAACGRASCEACWESLVAYRYTQVWQTRAGRRAANRDRQAERERRADLVRDIFGDPFQQASVPAAWQTSTVVSLAQQMYDTRDFTLMPLLAEALQDAGCADEDILSHCRGPGPHVRGCWVVDLILGKE